MFSQPDTKRPDSPGKSRLGPLALLLVLLSACAVQSAPASAPEPEPEPQPELFVRPAPEPTPRVITLEDGTYLEIRPGMEPGFIHCCGDSGYMLEMDCSDRLMRCYQSKGRRWKQTYGKHCKRALEEECYLETCTRVCEAIESVDDQR